MSAALSVRKGGADQPGHPVQRRRGPPGHDHRAGRLVAEPAPSGAGARAHGGVLPRLERGDEGAGAGGAGPGDRLRLRHHHGGRARPTCSRTAGRSISRSTAAATAPRAARMAATRWMARCPTAPTRRSRRWTRISPSSACWNTACVPTARVPATIAAGSASCAASRSLADDVQARALQRPLPPRAGGPVRRRAGQHRLLRNAARRPDDAPALEGRGDARSEATSSRWRSAAAVATAIRRGAPRIASQRISPTATSRPESIRRRYSPVGPALPPASSAAARCTANRR